MIERKHRAQNGKKCSELNELSPIQMEACRKETESGGRLKTNVEWLSAVKKCF